MYEQERRQVLYDKKWHCFIKRARLFRHLPFIEFAFGAGSMALGNVVTTSDFDVLVGVKPGRIFTARFFAAVGFSLFGWRRSKMDHRDTATDKICLNHFVTPQTYRLTQTVNTYWQDLYSNLVPIYGNNDLVQQFFKANADWMIKPVIYSGDMRHQYHTPSKFKIFLESWLSGHFGNWFEKKLKHLQVRRIKKGLKAVKQGVPHHIALGKGRALTLPPLIRYNDNELEFHPDAAVIEMGK